MVYIIFKLGHTSFHLPVSLSPPNFNLFDLLCTAPLGVPVLIEAPRPDTAPPPAMDPINVGVPTQSLQQEPPALAESSEKKQSILKSKVKKNKKKKTEEV